MSALYSTRSIVGRRPSAFADVADLNVTPVMNMFIILIPFLISMSAYTHWAALDLNLPGNDSPHQGIERKDLPLTIALGQKGFLLVEGDVVFAEFPLRQGKYDWDGLLELLGARKPELLVVAVDPSVSTSILVSCLDLVRDAGCQDVGLAEGFGVEFSQKDDQ